MSRPNPTLLYHFTHIGHLGSVAAKGLLSDTHAAESGLITTEIGQPGIKYQRRCRPVPCGAGGMASDYVPFYYATRSPMLYAIRRGRAASYTEGQDPLVYLVTTVEQLLALDLGPVFTDRNAALAITQFTATLGDLDDLVDWDLMRATMWANTPEDPDRRERRMAECLVNRRVPWEAFIKILTISQDRRRQVETILSGFGINIPVRSHPEAYF